MNRSTRGSPPSPPRAGPVPSLSKPYTKSPPEIFSIFLKKATFSSHTRTTFSNQKSRKRRIGDLVFRLARAFSVFSVDDDDASRPTSSSPPRRPRRESRRERARYRTSRPSVSPSRHIQHTSSNRRRKRTRARQSVFDRVNARGEGMFLSHEPSCVPPPCSSCPRDNPFE